MEIKWEDPPEHALEAGQKGGRYREFAIELRKHPGRWALLPGERATVDSAKNTAGNLRLGRMKPFPKGEFEVALDGTKIYVRYVPQAGSDGQRAPGTDVERALPIGEEDQSPKAEAVRKWARENGYEVAGRGRISSDVHEAYKRAHPASTDASTEV